MQSSQIERTLRGMMDAETKRTLDEDKWSGARTRRGLFGRKTQAASGSKTAVLPSAKQKSAKTPFSSTPVHPRSRRSDLVVAALGIALGFGCAAFPWYIFLHQDSFGIRAIQFGGGGEQSKGPIYLGDQGERVGAPIAAEEIPPMQLDLFATGTPRRAPEDGLASDSTLVDVQPFPEKVPDFKLVYVANGRAMIEDDTGLFVVQKGSRLPDNSKVARIEQRAGKWVVVTSADRVMEVPPQ